MELGLCLIGIGREWGVGDRHVASAAETTELLNCAIALGIEFFDTAPSYGASEARLGAFLTRLDQATRLRLRIATKFGELWREDGATIIDHSYDTLCRSVDRSVGLLGHLHLLQIHKCTTEVLRSPDIARATAYARTLGIELIGASVSEPEACALAVDIDFIDAIQLPLNRRRTEMLAGAHAARARGKLVISNRPVDSGQLLVGIDDDARVNVLRDSFRFLADEDTVDVVLTGTRYPAHLEQNYKAFGAAATETRRYE
jgi:aryl-alcohol dehydrogenase-like predicted oxidoreductase